jgi:hypothetical protein
MEVALAKLSLNNTLPSPNSSAQGLHYLQRRHRRW